MAQEAPVINGKKRRLTKNEKRRLKKKQEKKNQNIQSINGKTTSTEIAVENQEKPNVEVIYVSPKLEETEVQYFKDVFEKFAKAEDLTKEEEREEKKEEEPKMETVDDLLRHASEQVEKEATEEKRKKLTRKEQKAAKRLLIARLKQTVDRPDVVESHDATAPDPHLLIFLKAYRNTVPVPVHWCAKHKYLMGKRGLEKPPFRLPEFIAQTGIAKIRSAVEEKESTIKQRARERIAPKMGRIDIDYKVLHDAFFKYQTKPKLTGHGDIYFEGMENDVTLKYKKPGQLSARIRDALGMPENAPPPWLINMQRYGPPPSYPSLKIPGLNAPIPKGASFGFHPGGWGKPPVDQFGKPLYGNVFDREEDAILEDLQKTGGKEKGVTWGGFTMEEDMSESESEEEEEEAIEPTSAPAIQQQQPQVSVQKTQREEELPPQSSENEREIDLRKGYDEPSDQGPKELYKVIGQKQASVGGDIHGSSYTYAVKETEEVEDMTGFLSKQETSKQELKKPNASRPTKSYDDFKF